MVIFDKTDTVSKINKSKRPFFDIYNTNDPHPYFREMVAVDYQIPQNAKLIIDFLLYEILKRKRIGRISIVDVGCSYGVLSSLIKYNLDMKTLYSRYVDRRKDIDYKDLPYHDYIDFYGIDFSKSAVDYALKNSLLTKAFSGNLEEVGADALKSCHFPKACDIIVSTGCFGYVTERTFATLLSHMTGSAPPIIATFVMQPFDFTDAANKLGEFGYQTREFTPCKFRQRRFFDSEERNLLHHQQDNTSHTTNDTYQDDYIYATLHISEHRFPPLAYFHPFRQKYRYFS